MAARTASAHGVPVTKKAPNARRIDKPAPPKKPAKAEKPKVSKGKAEPKAKASKPKAEPASDHKKVAKPVPAPKAEPVAAGADGKRPLRKGITIVSPKPTKK